MRRVTAVFNVILLLEIRFYNPVVPSPRIALGWRGGATKSLPALLRRPHQNYSGVYSARSSRLDAHGNPVTDSRVQFRGGVDGHGMGLSTEEIPPSIPAAQKPLVGDYRDPQRLSGITRAQLGGEV